MDRENIFRPFGSFTRSDQQDFASYAILNKGLNVFAYKQRYWNKVYDLITFNYELDLLICQN